MQCSSSIIWSFPYILLDPSFHILLYPAWRPTSCCCHTAELYDENTIFSRHGSLCERKKAKEESCRKQNFFYRHVIHCASLKGYTSSASLLQCSGIIFVNGTMILSCYAVICWATVISECENYDFWINKEITVTYFQTYHRNLGYDNIWNPRKSIKTSRANRL